MKKTAVAPSNIAFIKYWGRKDEDLKLPTNGSISMNLSNLTTTTSVEFDNSFTEDQVIINSKRVQGDALKKIIAHVDRIRKQAECTDKVSIISENNFPQSTGLSSSASGFAALTLAATEALNLHLSQRELSILSRLGSGSACRSIPDGFVEWLDGDTSDTSYGVSLFDETYWDIVDVVCIVSTDVKDVPTTKGQVLAHTSPFFPLRLGHMNERIRKIKEALQEKDFRSFGEIVESEALEMHAVMITSHPALLYWHPHTLYLMQRVQKLRQEGLPVYFTINTGHNIHLITQKPYLEEVKKAFESEEVITELKINYPSKGTRIV